MQPCKRVLPRQSPSPGGAERLHAGCSAPTMAVAVLVRTVLIASLLC